ncbi:hypothetical protein GCM10012275_38250 [Longimycelium tulufanense]|uniref:Uncharacterized protein n=1 Tax=Longimycelium tulufanense TaxID=907463 RepID=A0A8J3CDM9_9PSEU|nr:hypothetical protein [Longimycelium tulufanense]GGM64082.1 hypothetical protein GCM10012275_38250 [Longimycelium tulufanense]
MAAGVKVVGTDAFTRLGRELKQAGNGQLRRDMTRAMRKAAGPAVNEAQSNVKATSSKAQRGGGRFARAQAALARKKKVTERAKQRAFAQRGLRDSVARTVKIQTSTSGRSSAVRVRSRRKLMPEDQERLPRHMNKGRWRHPVFGGDRWVTQTVTPPGWFDRAMQKHGPIIRGKAFTVVLDTLDRLGS